MNNKSLWSEIKQSKIEFPKKKTSVTDILIIGGGIAGLTCAYFLKDKNYKVMLIDKSKIGNGVTSKTTGKITILQGDIYSTLEKYYDKYVSKQYYESQKEGVNLLKKIIETNNIDCDLEKEKSIIFTLKKNNIEKIEKEKKLLETFGENVKYIKNKNIKKGISIEESYTFHPLKYIESLKEIIKDKVIIYEGITAQNMKKDNDRYIVNTTEGNIYAKKVIVTTHYPFFIKPLFIPLKTYIKREYVNAFKIENKNNFNAINIDNKIHSIRYYKDYLIYTSNNHRLTSKLVYKKNYKKSEKDTINNFNLIPNYTWMNQDIMSNDYLPFIGRIHKNFYVATAFNSWGMTNGTLSGKIISDLIIHNYSTYKELFNPTRINAPLVINSIIGTFHYLKAYISSLFIQNPKYIKIDGIIYGVYKDEKGINHKIKLLCPHMKCKLIFNAEEKTWDCPCHGSRFDLDGNIIEGPSTKNIKCNK